MSEEILKLFEHESAARSRYMYFVCALAAGLFAYIGKDYFPVHPIDNAGWFTIAALASFVLCLAFGMGNLQLYIQMLNANKGVFATKQDLKVCNTSIFKHKTGEANFTHDMVKGGERSIEEIQADIERFTVEMADKSAKVEKYSKWICRTHPPICHAFLIIGFILLIVSKFIA